MFGKSVGKLFTVCEWIMKLAYVNILWFLFTAAGLVMFGFMPATVALFTIVRKWLMKEIDIPIWRTFLTVYKNEFRKSNVLGFILVVCGTLIYIDFQFLLNTEGIIQLVMSIFLLIIACFYLILLSFFFPVYVHYDLKVVDYLKYAFLLGALNFHMVLFMLAGLSATVFLMLYVPGLIPFFSAVSISCVLMSGGVYSFKRVQKLQMKARVAG